MTIRFVLSFAALALIGATPALAQDAAAAPLPEICTSGAAQDMGTPSSGHDMGSMDQAHQDLMAGMDDMNAKMAQGMTAADVDVAFVCGMIAHHQGAISMAKAELANGDDQWAKDMAQKVVDAQEQEIVDMLQWLEEQAAK